MAGDDLDSFVSSLQTIQFDIPRHGRPNLYVVQRPTTNDQHRRLTDYNTGTSTYLLTS
jgi:hypothetical protein